MENAGEVAEKEEECLYPEDGWVGSRLVGSAKVMYDQALDLVQKDIHG
jgi:hypothetical protein